MVLFRRKRGSSRRRDRKEKSTLHHVILGVIAILIVVLVCVAIWYVTRLPSVTISSVTVEGGETISHDHVRSLVEEELRGDYFLLIPHRFTYFYPHETIVNSLKNVPRLHAIVVERKGRTELHVSFDEYQPYALWCLWDDDTAPCYFMDSKGYAFAPAPALRGGALTRYVVEESGELRETDIISEEIIGKTSTFADVLERELGFRVSQITITKEGDLKYRINGGGEILTTSDMSIEETFENLKSILDSEEFSHLVPGNFNYIDLRFGNKIFVNEELEPVATTTGEEPVSN